MKTIGLHSVFEIKGIYITPAKKIIGIPIFRQDNQEYREFPKCVELWQKTEDGDMQLQKRWRKKSITYIEYSDIPNTWVEPRALQK
jgi:hypothetical protein